MLNILLVDDSKTVRSVLAKTLELSRLPINEILEAENGRQALDLMDNNWVDLVLADINMPVLNGIEMVEKMYSDGLLKTIPVIIVSTEGSATRIEQLKSRGISAYIRKPFTPELIRSVVEDILGVKGNTGAPDVLTRTLQEVMEKTAFVYPEPVSIDEIPQCAGPCLMASMNFTGEKNGSLAMAIPRQLCLVMTANITGTEEDLPDTADQVNDAMGELLSMCCGNILTALYGPEPVFDMSPPKIADLDEGKWNRLMESENTLGYTIENLPMIVDFMVNESVN